MALNSREILKEALTLPFKERATLKVDDAVWDFGGKMEIIHRVVQKMNFKMVQPK